MISSMQLRNDHYDVFWHVLMSCIKATAILDMWMQSKKAHNNLVGPEPRIAGLKLANIGPLDRVYIAHILIFL